MKHNPNTEEIEITPEMIEAGRDVFCRIDHRGNEVDAVRRIFVAMVAAWDPHKGGLTQLSSM